MDEQLDLPRPQRGGRPNRAAGHALQSVRDLRLSDVVDAVYRRRWLFVGSVIAAVLLAYGYNNVTTPLYQARARLMIDPGASKVVTFRPVVDEDARDLQYYE